MSALPRELLSIAGLKNSLADSGIDFEEDVKLSKFSYMKTGGAARVIAFPRSKESFANCLKIARDYGVKYKVVGNTSNLLFLDDTDYGFLICTTNLDRILVRSDGTIFAQAGVMVPTLAREALFHSLGGMEGLEGIPGTLGGAIFMNAGGRSLRRSIRTATSRSSR
jgi:UDP-N-acetylmuramate dehydrogenase